MNIGQKNFNFIKQNNDGGFYVIIEQNSIIPFSEHSFRIIGVTNTLANAQKFLTSNRIIKGPVPILDNNFIFPEIPIFLPDPQIKTATTEQKKFEFQPPIFSDPPLFLPDPQIKMEPTKFEFKPPLISDPNMKSNYNPFLTNFNPFDQNANTFNFNTKFNFTPPQFINNDKMDLF